MDSPPYDKTGTNQSGSGQRHQGHHHQQPTSSDLMSSAKLVAEAAQATFRHQQGKVDKGRVAGATGDLLNAACHYGHLEDKAFGKYVEKAETYLHQYGSSHSSSTTTAAHTGGAATHNPSHSGGEHVDSGSGYGDYMKTAQGFMAGGGGGATTHNPTHPGGDAGDSGSGYGDYMKMAQGFLAGGGGATHKPSHSGGDDGDSGSGYGDYFKMAEGFLKKH